MTQNSEQQAVLEETAREAAHAAQIAADAARQAGDAAERIRRMVKKIKNERAKRKGVSNLHLPEMQLMPVASLGPCQVLAVTAPEHKPALEYVLAAKAMAEKKLVIKEVSGAGSVPMLLVKNKLDTPVLILEGDLLIGGKQNRLSNSSVLIPEKTKMPLPVSCIEHGRWGHKSHRPESFSSSMDCIAAPVSRELKRAKLSASHASIQSEVWNSVDAMQDLHAFHSPTSDHEELLRVSRSKLEAFLESTQCPDEAVGVAVVVGEHNYALDLFDQVETCRHYWQMKVHSSLMQWGGRHHREELFSTAALEEDIEALHEDRWKEQPAEFNYGEQLGEKTSSLGSELHAHTERKSMASALAYAQLPVHLTLLSQH